MNRSRRAPVQKTFIAGGVYDPSEKQQQQATPVVQSVSARNYSYQNTPKRALLTPTPKTEPPTSAASTPAKPNASQLVPTENEPELKTIIKENLNAEESVSIAKSDHEDESMDEDGEADEVPKRKGKNLLKNIFANRKKSAVRTKEKKIRQNRQLRKVIFPKNALMALNEVRGITIGDFVISSVEEGGFTALVTINDTQYHGRGTSKVAAKNNACEKALRDYVIAKMRQKPRRSIRQPKTESTMDITEAEGENGVQSDLQNQTEEDAGDVPMINLTSFALYKLFASWENDGYEIPEFHPSSSNASGQFNTTDSDTSSVHLAPKEPKKPPIRTILPDNWETMHPATLLCVMRPGLAYTNYGTVEGRQTIQSLGIIVDDQEFIGNGRSKKIARRNAAAKVCNTLFDTNFDIEEDVEADVKME